MMRGRAWRSKGLPVGLQGCGGGLTPEPARRGAGGRAPPGPPPAPQGCLGAGHQSRLMFPLLERQPRCSHRRAEM